MKKFTKHNNIPSYIVIRMHCISGEQIAVTCQGTNAPRHNQPSTQPAQY